MEISEKELAELEERVKARKTRYVPNVKKEDLIHGEYYLGHCRNAIVARWNGEEGIFYHWRTKFGHSFIETIHCPEDEQYYDVFVTDRAVAEHELKDVKEIPFQ